MPKPVVEVGPWGGNNAEATLWSFRLEDSWKLTEIDVFAGTECVDGIKFTYIDEGGHECSQLIGVVTKNVKKYDIPAGRTIIEMRGSVGFRDVGKFITSLSFEIGTQTDGPFGIPRDTPFNLPVASGDVSGFFGKKGAHIDSLGVMLSPIN